MPTVEAVLARKGGQVVTIGAADSALTAATLMNERGIGGLVVLDAGRVAGMFTERDILRRVVAMKRDPAATPVRDVMTTPVAFCRRETTLGECRAVMTEKRIRHLPVVDDKGVCGICVRAVPFSEASVDHVIPISRGGQHSWDNVRLTHIRCNMRKGSRLDSELPGLV